MSNRFAVIVARFYTSAGLVRGYDLYWMQRKVHNPRNP